MSKQRRNRQQRGGPSHSAAAQLPVMPDTRPGSALETPRQRTNVDRKKGEFAVGNTILDIGQQDQTCGYCGALVWHTKKKLTDIGGVLLDAGDIEYERNNVTRLNRDTSLAEIKVHLWGKMATLFRLEIKMSRNKNVVLVIIGLSVKSNKGTIILSSTPATDLFFNPNCKELQHLPQQITNTYGDFIIQVPNHPKYPYQLLPESDTAPPYSIIQEILQHQPSTHQKLRCDAIILDILLRDTHHQGSCIRCKDLVAPERNKYYCRNICARNYIIPHVNRNTPSNN